MQLCPIERLHRSTAGEAYPIHRRPRPPPTTMTRNMTKRALSGVESGVDEAQVSSSREHLLSSGFCSSSLATARRQIANPHRHPLVTWTGVALVAVQLTAVRRG